jgi:hypothetical protein
MAETQERLAELLRELEAGKHRMGAAPQPPSAEEKAREEQTMRREAEQRLVDSPVLPGERAVGRETKTVGKLFVESDIYRRFSSGTWPQGVPTERFEAPSPFMVEQKAVVGVGAGVIQAGRDARRVRLPEMDRLTIRDVMDVRPLSSNTADFVTVGPGTVVAVRTIAVTTPIDEATLQDVDQVQRIIDDELSYQVRLVEERQMLWGNGTGQNLQGLIPLAGVPAITRGAAQLLDRIAAGQTDVRLAGFEPNAVVIHPLDWEAIVALKATGGEYIHSDSHVDPANLRVWGMNVVITVSAKSPTATTRSLIVGDFQRGATLYDRSTLAVQFGYVSDQFRRNQRTLRAEERVAFAIRSPLAFAKFQTAA